MQEYDDLKRAIAETALVRAESGRTIINSEKTGALGMWLFDFRALILQPHWIDRYAEIFWEKYAHRYPFQVGGMETGAIPLVTAIVMKSVERKTPVNGFFIRKSRKRQGLMQMIEGTLTKDPVILVDDLINSGGTFNKQIAILAQVGVSVSDIFVMLRFRNMSAYSFAEEKGVMLDSLFTLEDFDTPLLPDTAPELPKNSFNERWKFVSPRPSYHVVVHKSAPALDGTRLFFGSDSGVFRALDQETGAVRWEFKVGRFPGGKGTLSSPAVANGTVYFGAYDGVVYALDVKTGVERWRYSDADWVGSSPAVASDLGLAFIGLEFGLFRKRGGIVALDLKTGAPAWSDRTPALTHGSPLYIPEEKMVVIGSNDGVVYAYDAKTGERRWQHQTNGDIKMRPAYDAKRRQVVACSMDGRVYMLAARDGTPIAAHETGAGIYSAPLVVGDTAYVASLDKHLYAIDLATGKERWSFATGGRIFSSPVLADGSIWIGSNDGRLYEIDPTNGTLRRFFQATERIVSAIAYNPATRDLFVPTVANEMYCLRKTE